MKPPKFDYAKAESVQGAITLLMERAGNAKIIAGGQSLLPLLNFRLLSPSLIVDISQIDELKCIHEEEEHLTIGAAVRHYDLETSSVIAKHFPIISEAMTHVAHLAIRNKGTIGGSLCHGDPAAELPMLIQLLNAELYVVGAKGDRTIDASDFYFGPLTPDIEEDEVLVEIRLPYLKQNTFWDFQEFTRKSGDFAVAACGVLLNILDEKIEEVRIAVMGVDDTPLRVSSAEEMLVGKALDEDSLSKACVALWETVQPNSDLQASADYKRHLIGELFKKSITNSWKAASGENDG